jgi:hypothetical protein
MSETPRVAGAAVAHVARSQTQLTETAAGIGQAGGRALPLVANVTDAVAVRQAVREAARVLGPITLLVNNAGSGGPQLLVGGDSPAALRRMARCADGWVARAGSPEAFTQHYPRVLAAWEAAERPGKPRVVALAGFGLGPKAREETRHILGDYYAHAGAHAERIAASALVTVEAIREAVAGFESAGCDELLMFPALADPGQVGLLAEALRYSNVNSTLLSPIGR